ncbi:MAG TPA: hypothetical protein DCQ64_18615 [Candidatus Rokubacteria bacterium]|nr:hypothetical protein [Candidatus Rokubacteria bacterium]
MKHGNDQHVGNTRAGAVGAGGEAGAFGTPARKTDQKGTPGGKPDSGALAAFGGIRKSTKIAFERGSGRPNITKPGYPGQGSVDTSAKPKP